MWWLGIPHDGWGARGRRSRARLGRDAKDDRTRRSKAGRKGGAVRVSVVTVSFNSATTVERTLQSVRRQTHPDLEHIVIDGASTDGTLHILDQYRADLAQLVSEPDRGLYHAMNKGWRLATGDVVGFLNSDDELAAPDVISRIVAAFEQSGSDAVYGDLDLVARGGSEDRVLRRWRSGRFSRLKYHWGWMTPHPATYVRRQLFLRHGGFREDLAISADYELMLRFFYLYRARVTYLPLRLVSMAVGGASNGSVAGVARANWEVYQSWRLNQLRTSPTILFTKPLSKLLQLRF